jgi:ribonuclease P protein component
MRVAPAGGRPGPAPGCPHRDRGPSICALTARGPPFDARGETICTYTTASTTSGEAPGSARRRRPCRPRPAGPRASGGLVVEEARSEAHVPTEQPAPGQAARLPSPHVDPRGSRRGAEPPAQGPRQAVGLIWRIRDRRTFVALRKHGVRVRSGPLTITALLDPPSPAPAAASSGPPAAGVEVPAGTVGPTDPPRVAFAIGRKVGHAVVRNRLRRQLRAICAELAGVSLVPGAYLVSVQPAAAELSYAELRTDVQRALSRLDPGSRPAKASAVHPDQGTHRSVEP